MTQELAPVVPETFNPIENRNLPEYANEQVPKFVQLLIRDFTLSISSLFKLPDSCDIMSSSYVIVTWVCSYFFVVLLFIPTLTSMKFPTLFPSVTCFLAVSMLQAITILHFCLTKFSVVKNFYSISCVLATTSHHNGAVCVVWFKHQASLLLFSPWVSVITSLEHRTSDLPRLWILTWSNSKLCLKGKS